MDKLYNIQQLKECFGQQTKFNLLDISKAIKLLVEIEQLRRHHNLEIASRKQYSFEIYSYGGTN